MCQSSWSLKYFILYFSRVSEWESGLFLKRRESQRTDVEEVPTGGWMERRDSVRRKDSEKERGSKWRTRVYLVPLAV